MWTESESDQEPSDAAKVPGVVQAHWVYQGWEAVVGLSRVRAQRLRTPLSQNGSQVLSRLIYCSADWPGLEHTGTSFLLEITDSTFKSLFKWTQCDVPSCSVPFQLSRQINLQGGKIIRWQKQRQEFFSLFAFFSKVEIGRRQHLTKVPSGEQKRMQMPHLRLKASANISSN